MKKIIILHCFIIVFLFNITQTFAAPVYYNVKQVDSGVSVCNLVGVTDLKSLLSGVVNCLLEPAVVVIASLAVFIFLYKIFIFVTTNNVEKKQEMLEFAVWGIIAIFVMVSFLGLVNVLQRTFTFQDRVTPRNVNISY